MNKDEKRRAGQVEGGKWLVLTESQGEDGKGFIHKCGEKILAFTRTYPVYPFQDIPGWELAGTGEVRSAQIPFCPKCEERS